jgi:hypothetical protein
LIFIAVKEFLIYSIAHNNCISIKNESVTASSCEPMMDNQRWRWTHHNQLQNIFNQACLGVSGTPAEHDRVEMFSCDPNDEYQAWACVGDMIRLKGTNLNLHYDSNDDRVALKTWTGPWTKWNVYGEDKPVCGKRPQGILG